MPVPIKCTAFFGSDQGWGWSETHHVLGDDPPGPLGPFMTAFKGLIDDKRRPLLGRDRYVAGLRVSFQTSTGGIASSAFRYAPLLFPGNQREGCAPHLAAQMRMAESENQQFSNCYLRGFWDALEVDEELDFTTAAGVAWKALQDQYIAALVAGGYGWLGTDEPNTRRGKVTNYTVDVGGFVTFTVTIDSGPALPAVGTLLPFRIARLNHSQSVLNRTHVVRVASPTTVTTVQRTAALDFESAGTFVSTATTFLAYIGAQYTVLARRAVGRSFFHSPGRLKARARA